MRTNGYVIDKLASALEIEPADIVGYVIIAITTDQHTRMASNGNHAQALVALNAAIDCLEKYKGEVDTEQTYG